MKLRIFLTVIVLLFINSLLNAQIVVLHDISCAGDNTGSLLVIPDFGSPPYTYQWNTGAVTSSIGQLSAGTYSVTVTDTFSNVQVYTYSFIDPVPLVIITDAIGHVNCKGAATGYINITVNGGNTPYSYVWLKNGLFYAATEDLVQIPAGNYSLQITDNKGCSSYANFVIQEPSTGIELQITSVDVNCFGGNNGSANVYASGGTGVLSILWSTGETTAQIYNLTAGTYSVTVTDAQLCSVSATVSVTQPTSPIQITTIQTDNLCFGAAEGSAEIVDVSGANGPLSYQWSTGSTMPFISGLISGNYTVTVTDALNCNGVASVFIQQPSQIQLVSSIITPSNCDGHNNGAISITATGGVLPYQFLWREIHFDSTYTTQNIANVRGGDYKLTITDANGCLFTDTLTIPNLVYVPANFTVNSYVCNGLQGGVGIHAPEADSAYYFTYSWSSTYNTGSFVTNDTVFTASTAFLAGSYTITVTNNQTGCAHYFNFTINQSATPMTVAEVIHHNSCYEDNSGSIILYPTGGDPLPAYQVTWSGPNGFTSSSFHIQHLSPGDYFYTVTDDRACIVQGTARVEPVYPLQGHVVSENVQCFGGNSGWAHAVFSGGTGNLNYLWSTGAASEYIQSLVAGTYTVSVTDSLGCLKTQTITISQPPELYVIVDNITNVSCFGYSDGAIAITTGGGIQPFSFGWTHNGLLFNQITEDISALQAGQYTLVVTDAAGCTTTETFTVSQPEETLFIDSVHVISCNNGSDGYWEIIPVGIYHPYIAVFSTGDTISTDTIASLSISGLNAGIYYCTITSANGCQWSFSQLFEQPLPITVGLANIEHVVCKGDSTGAITLDAVHGGTPPYTYLWSNGGMTNPLTGIPAGIYNVQITDSKLCSIYETYEVHEPYEYIKYFPTVTNTTCRQSEDGTIVLFPADIYWSPFQNTFYVYDTIGFLIAQVSPGQIVSGLPQGNYVTFLVNEHGCMASDTVRVELGSEDCILIPNLVTPNSDGYNDVFAVRGGCEYDSFYVQIFTDWGAEVFQSSDCAFLWNPKDIDAASGTVFYYYIRVSDKGKTYEFKSSIDVKY